MRSFISPEKRSQILKLDLDLWNEIKPRFTEAVESTRTKFEARLLEVLPKDVADQLRRHKSGHLSLQRYGSHPLSAFVELQPNN